ncbi:MAG: patatin-like phospholipase family protein [Gemmatimonadales bacterium]
MQRLGRCAFALLTLAAGIPAHAQSCAPAKTALVLAGGGTKGFAHIGVMEVMDSLGLKPDLIVGTSIGAIMGALYASGYSGAQIDSLTRALPIEGVIRRYEPKVSTALGLNRPAAVWEQGQSGYVLQSGATREGEVNALLSAMLLRGNLLARGDFDSLAIPFRAIATDVRTHDAVQLSRGDLARAVRASAAIPIVLKPVHLDGEWLTDGGVADNVPVRFARQLGAERLWVSLLPYGAPDPKTFEDPIALSISLINLIFHQDSLAPSVTDVVIANPTRGHVNLDFNREHLDSLIEMGRRTARTAFAAQGCLRPLATRPPRAFPVTVRDVALTGARPGDADALLRDLGLEKGDTINMPGLEDGILGLGHSERYRGLWLTPSGTGTEASFHVEVEQAPRRTIGVGVAFDQFMSGRLWIGGVDRSLGGGDAEAVLLTHLGSYEQDVAAFVRRRALVGRRYMPFAVGASVAHESVRLFEGRGELPAAETRELVGFIGLKQDPEEARWRFDAGIDSRLWRDPGRNTRGAVGVRAAVFRARNEYEMGTIAEAIVLNDFQRARLDASTTWELGSVEVRARLRAGWGNRLPIAQTFTLGGDDGFAGLRIGEYRGSQEAFGSLLFKRGIASFLSLRLEPMAGAIGRGDGALRREPGTYYGEWFTGVRAGIEVDTPLGPIRAEEGFSSDGRRGALIRVGYWF